jgi:hypothetical protein
MADPEQEDGDAAMAQKLQDELERESQAEYARQLEQHFATQEERNLTSGGGGGVGGAPQSPAVPSTAAAAAAAESDKTQLATKVPPGVGPGGRIKVRSVLITGGL